jgi:hypothetical protein
MAEFVVGDVVIDCLQRIDQLFYIKLVKYPLRSYN